MTTVTNRDSPGVTVMTDHDTVTSTYGCDGVTVIVQGITGSSTHSDRDRPGQTPKRVRQRRLKGWHKPDAAISVARPHKWGNPFVVGAPGVPDAETAVRLFREWLPGTDLSRDLPDLTGHDLMCFCPLDRHATLMCCSS